MSLQSQMILHISNSLLNRDLNCHVHSIVHCDLMLDSYKKKSVANGESKSNVECDLREELNDVE